MGENDGPSEKYDSATPPEPKDVYATHVHWNPKWEEVKQGLTQDEWQRRFDAYGPNGLPEIKISPIWNYLKHYTGPMPTMIWLAIVLLLIKTLFFKPAWPDLIMCILLQFVNANVKYYNAENAKHAIEALKSKMAPRCFVRRDGNWTEQPARELVPGDVVQINIGMIIPADIRFGPCENIQSDQAALTGESLPASKSIGSVGYASSVIKRGEGEGVVVGTGECTEMGKAAKLVASVKKRSRYDYILFYVALYLLTTAFVLMTFQAFWQAFVGQQDIVTILAATVTILIGALPVAMHVVCMTIMAVGAYRLSLHGAVVSELTAVEELSGMTILCSDKTGTLTLNKLEIIQDKCTLYGKYTIADLYWYAALGCKRATDGLDAIDSCIVKTLEQKCPEKWSQYASFPTKHFVPFDPISKRTEGQIAGPNGDKFAVTKGAPQVILAMSHNFEELKSACSSQITTLAGQGYRTLGIARSCGDNKWDMVGLLAIADPPRKDTKMVIQAANSLGIKVIMITGDQTAIAREVGKQIGIGQNIMSAALLADIDKLPLHVQSRLPDMIERSDGFAEVFPEHKFRVVQELQRNGHIVGMTGDGVNDAPALKLANVGIAVSGSTDAARAAASIFLQNEGLSVIISAIMRSKKVFERVKNYIIYRSATSLRLMGFFFVCIVLIPPIDWMPEVKVPGFTEDQVNWRDDANKNHCFDEKTVEDTIDCIEKKGWQDYKIWKWANLCLEGLCERGIADADIAIGTNCKDYKALNYNVFQFCDPQVPTLPANSPGPLGCPGVANPFTLSQFHNPANAANKDKRLIKCIERLHESDFYVSKTFQTPTLVVVVLTLLNDFTVLTIAFDHVQISHRPDKWHLWRNIAVGTIIGANTLLWSVLMFLFMLGSLDPTNTQYQAFGIHLEYPECITGAFLQLSLCARLARTNARTEGWFCRLSLHRSVVMTMTFSIVAAILLGFTWPFCSRSARNCDPHMEKLNPKMVGIIVLYQIPVHIIRDVCKQALWRYFNEKDKAKKVFQAAAKELIDNDCKSILREMEMDVDSGVGKDNVANSVTLQAVDRERSGKFTYMTEKERIDAAQQVAAKEIQALKHGDVRSISKGNDYSGTGGILPTTPPTAAAAAVEDVKIQVDAV